MRKSSESLQEFLAALVGLLARYYETLIKGLPQGLPEGFIKGLPKGFAKGFAKGLPKGLPKGFAKPFGEGLGKGFGKPETEAVTEPEPETETEAEADLGAEAEAEKETVAENFPAASSEELKTLNVIKEVNGYPFYFTRDLGFLRELKKDFSRLNMLEEVKKWKEYKLDKPIKKNSNARSQLRNCLTRAGEWRTAGDSGPGNGSSGNDSPGGLRFEGWWFWRCFAEESKKLTGGWLTPELLLCFRGNRSLIFAEIILKIYREYLFFLE